MNKILIVLNGESFRDGGTGVRTSGNNSLSIRQQFSAIESHIRLIDKIESSFNFKCDIFINSYKSNDLEKKMLDLYGSRVVDFNFHDNRLKDEFEMIEDTIARIKKIKSFNDYRNILFIRNDLYIKKYLIDIFKLNDDKVIYSFVDSNPSFNIICESMSMDKCDNFVPVSHLITLVPNKYFKFLDDNNVFYWHYSGSRLIGALNNEPHNHIDFFIDTVHWCNSSIEWNPLFNQVGRSNSNIYNECKNIQIDVPSSDFIIASKGIRFDIKSCQKYLIENDTIYDYLINQEKIENKEIDLFY